MAKAIMIQGTMSNVGKSVLTAGLCRVLMQDGYRVAPFKSQNMALNSFVTAEGLELGRAQAVQAEASGLEPRVEMNPILLKPTTDCGSQLIVMGRVRGNMTAATYYNYKRELIPEIMAAYEALAAENDYIVIEGAGSPAEINLKQNDIVNMGMARMAKAPVLLVGDIDPGGVFAQLAGTLMLLTDDERSIVKALIINKFRGDREILRPGLAMLEEITKKPVAGVIPMLSLDIDDEDSQSRRLESSAQAALDIAVIRTPRMANFTDLSALAASKGVAVRYVQAASDLLSPDLIILPGSKSTIADLLWLRNTGLDKSLLHFAAHGTPIIGICGGYQMLGESLRDETGVEGGGFVQGLGLLPIRTEFCAEKHCARSQGSVINAAAPFDSLIGAELSGYEIHMGKSTLLKGAAPFIKLADGSFDGCVRGNVCGSYLHGLFDSDVFRKRLLFSLCDRKRIARSCIRVDDYAAHRQQEYDRLADCLRENLDMQMIYRILEEGL